MNIIIADDHPIFRQGLVKIVEHVPDIAVVGEAGDGKQALHLIQRLRPDIAVLDISMPMMTGLEVVQAVNRQSLKCEFVMLTMYKEEEYFNEAMDLGVKGYLLKESAVDDLLTCLRTVSAGNYYVSPIVSDYLVKRTSKRQLLTHQAPDILLLTPMELRVLKLISENKTSKEIADDLHVSFRTVQNHRTNICAKLGLEGHNKLLLFAIANKSHL